MVEHVGRLIDELVISTVGRLNDGLQGLLAHLLRHLVHAVAEQASGVAAFRHLLVTLLNEVLKLTEEGHGAILQGRTLQHSVCLAPARVGAGVTGGAMGMDLDQQRVIVAVSGNAYQVEIVATGLTLRPQRLTATAPEGHLTGGQRLVVGLTVHKAEHEHIACVSILNDGGQQSAHLVKV